MGLLTGDALSFSLSNSNRDVNIEFKILGENNLISDNHSYLKIACAVQFTAN
jgi:hypothetical protein